MSDEQTKSCLHDQLRWAREAVVSRLDGVSEHDVRRPLTVTGTNLLGLVKHLATWEARYLGEVFDRPYPGGLPPWQVDDGSDLWAAADESREQVLDFYRRAREHADATIAALPLDAAGHVPWWPRPDVTLLGVLVHVLDDTARHAGHADILREQLDGRTGDPAGWREPVDTAGHAAHRTRVEAAAREASSTPPLPHVQVERVVANLTVVDLAAAVREHTAVLGLRVVMDHGWIVTLADDAGHQLSLMTTDATGPVNPDVSVFVDDVDRAHTAARAAGLEIVHPLSDEAWGVRRFFYRDGAGRVVNVGAHRP